ncbi:MAG: hypothetical protein R3F43_18465 [bacterium]
MEAGGHEGPRGCRPPLSSDRCPFPAHFGVLGPLHLRSQPRRPHEDRRTQAFDASARTPSSPTSSATPPAPSTPGCGAPAQHARLPHRLLDRLVQAPHRHPTPQGHRLLRRAGLPKSHWDDRPTDRPTTVLERLHHAMDRAWPTKGKPKRQTRSINIDFSSTEIGFDAVPAVERAGGGYWIPDRDQDAWIATNPKQHEAVLIAANEKAGGRLNPMIKMVKRWRRELKLRGIDAPFSSFHLEALACQRYTGWYAAQPPASLPAGVADLFDYLARKMQDTCPDPGGVGPALDAGMTSTQRRQAIGLLAQAASTAREALRLDAQGHTSSAHQQWVTLFGNDYHYRT